MKKLNLVALVAALVCGSIFTSCKDSDVAVTGVTLDKETLPLTEGGETVTLVATVLPDDATNKKLSWESSAPAVATVSAGVVTPVAPGTATITVTTDDGKFTDACTVTVTAATTPVASVSLDKDKLVFMEGGDPATLVASVLPTDATNTAVTWSSENEEIATVVNGVVTPVAMGTTTVTATAADGSGKFATAEISVTFMGEVWFQSDREFTVGTKVWSDAVMAQRCRKEDFMGGTINYEYLADCRQNGIYADTNEPFGDLYSWEAVNQYGEELCPEGWSVPTRADFIALNIALGGSGEDGWGSESEKEVWQKYRSEWGAQPGGSAQYAHYLGEVILNFQGSAAFYWTSEALDPNVSTRNAYTFKMSTPGFYQPAGNEEKANGFMLRCVKNA